MCQIISYLPCHEIYSTIQMRRTYIRSYTLVSIGRCKNMAGEKKIWGEEAKSKKRKNYCTCKRICITIIMISVKLCTCMDEKL